MTELGCAKTKVDELVDEVDNYELEQYNKKIEEYKDELNTVENDKWQINVQENMIEYLKGKIEVLRKTMEARKYIDRITIFYLKKRN